jgi:hypothetical protein
MALTVTKSTVNLRDGIAENNETSFMSYEDPTFYNAAFRYGFDDHTSCSGSSGQVAFPSGSFNYAGETPFGRKSLNFGETSTGYVDIQGTGGNNGSNACFSTGFWVRMTRHNPAGRTYLMDARTSNSSAGYWIIDAADTMTVVKNDNAEITFPFTPQFYVWEHIVLVSDPAQLNFRVYRNGKLYYIHHGNFCDHLSTTCTYGTYFGARGGSGNYFLQGSIKNLFLSYAAYNDRHVQAIYNNRNPY